MDVSFFLRSICVRKKTKNINPEVDKQLRANALEKYEGEVNVKRKIKQLLNSAFV